MKMVGAPYVPPLAAMKMPSLGSDHCKSSTTMPNVSQTHLVELVDSQNIQKRFTVQRLPFLQGHVPQHLTPDNRAQQ